MGIIYRLYCRESKKSYIGQTTQPFNSRMNEHKSSAKNDKGCPLLGKAIRKYGFDNFDKEILIECENNMLDYYEIKSIELYCSLHPNGYNLDEGGNRGNRVLSEATKKKMSESAINRDTSVYRKYNQSMNLPKYVSYVKETRNRSEGYV